MADIYDNYFHWVDAGSGKFFSTCICTKQNLNQPKPKVKKRESPYTIHITTSSKKSEDVTESHEESPTFSSCPYCGGKPHRIGSEVVLYFRCSSCGYAWHEKKGLKSDIRKKSQPAKSFVSKNEYDRDALRQEVIDWLKPGSLREAIGDFKWIGFGR